MTLELQADADEARRAKHREHQRAYRERNKGNPAHEARCIETERRRPKRQHSTEDARWYTIKHKYGLTKEQWLTLFGSQNNKCAICLTDTPGTHGWWHTDHCHESGVVRGILCHGCNVGLGGFKDNPTAITRAVDYLSAR